MRVAQGTLEVKTRSKFDIIDVTEQVESWLSRVGAGSGLLLVHVPHTTAAIAVNEAEPGLLSDILELLKELTKPGAAWRHNVVDDNAHAHLGNVIIDTSKTLPVAGGKLALGTWQRLLLIEMDGPRVRKLNLVYVGE